MFYSDAQNRLKIYPCSREGEKGVVNIYASSRAKAGMLRKVLVCNYTAQDGAILSVLQQLRNVVILETAAFYHDQLAQLPTMFHDPTHKLAVCM